jgi:hypothetical protein
LYFVGPAYKYEFFKVNFNSLKRDCNVAWGFREGQLHTRRTAVFGEQNPSVPYIFLSQFRSTRFALGRLPVAIRSAVWTQPKTAKGRGRRRRRRILIVSRKKEGPFPACFSRGRSAPGGHRIQLPMPRIGWWWWDSTCVSPRP